MITHTNRDSLNTNTTLMITHTNRDSLNNQHNTDNQILTNKATLQ